MWKSTEVLITLMNFQRPSVFILLLCLPCVIYSISEDYYQRLKDTYGLVDPYQLPHNKVFEDLEEIEDCDNCPRVYWPVCAHSNETFVNYCVATCLNETIRRYGPCIKYRRSGGKYMNILLPRRWRKEAKLTLTNK